MNLAKELAGLDINACLETLKATENAALIDVRSEDEFAAGHIPGAVNIPLERIDETAARYPERMRPLFLYCRSGRRSGLAESRLREMGYINAVNIGGIIDDEGEKVYA